MDASRVMVKEKVTYSTVTGGTIHMVCRNKDKAEEARADIVKETGNKVSSDSPPNWRFKKKQPNKKTHKKNKNMCDISQPS